MSWHVIQRCGQYKKWYYKNWVGPTLNRWASIAVGKGQMNLVNHIVSEHGMCNKLNRSIKRIRHYKSLTTLLKWTPWFFKIKWEIMLWICSTWLFHCIGKRHLSSKNNKNFKHHHWPSPKVIVLSGWGNRRFKFKQWKLWKTLWYWNKSNW